MVAPVQILFNDDINKSGQRILLKLESGSLILTMTIQALSQDLLHVSERLECLEDEVQRSSSERQTGGVTMEELEEERDALKKRRDKLDAQLKDNRVLTVEVRTKRTVCDFMIHFIVPSVWVLFHLCTLCVFM